MLTRILYGSLCLGLLATAPAVGQWVESQSLFAEDGAVHDQLGVSVAVFESIACVGAPDKDVDRQRDGAVYLFDAQTGLQRARLTASDPNSDARFGRAVAVSSDGVLIGAPGHSHDGLQSGAAYLFGLDTGEQIWEFLPQDGASGNDFGASVAIVDGFACVGSPRESGTGVVYIFDVATGAQVAKLEASDAGDAYAFGVSLAAASTHLLVGSVGATGAAARTGAAYIFDTLTWQETGKLSAEDGQAYDRFGDVVAIGNDTAAVAAAYEDSNGAFAGAVYLFDLASHGQLAKLQPANSHEYQYFGHGIAVAGSTVYIGATGDNNFSGSVFVFDPLSGEELGSLTPSDTHQAQLFGESVAIFGDTLLVGAFGDSVNGAYAGAAYLFPAYCPVDWNQDHAADSRDVIAYLGAWSQGVPEADLDHNGVVDAQDFILFLGVWAAGC